MHSGREGIVKTFSKWPSEKLPFCENTIYLSNGTASSKIHETLNNIININLCYGDLFAIKLPTLASPNFEIHEDLPYEYVIFGQKFVKLHGGV